MKKVLVLITILSLLVTLLVGCQSSKQPQTDSETETDTITETETETETEHQKLAGMTYLRPNDDSFDSFSITLFENGTYQYYETFISSYIGRGTYSLDGDVLTLTDDKIPTMTGYVIHTYKFEYRGNTIVYLAEESDQFLYVHLPDGAVFERGELQ